MSEKRKLMISTLLKLQLLYCALGIGYNIVNYVSALSGGKPLSSTSPVVGTVVMVIYGLSLISGLKLFYKVYRLLMLLFIVIFGYGGIIQHFIVYSKQPEAYASMITWLVAIGINLFGFGLNILAVAGWFEKNSSDNSVI